MFSWAFVFRAYKTISFMYNYSEQDRHKGQYHNWWKWASELVSGFYNSFEHKFRSFFESLKVGSWIFVSRFLVEGGFSHLRPFFIFMQKTPWSCYKSCLEAKFYDFGILRCFCLQSDTVDHNKDWVYLRKNQLLKQKNLQQTVHASFAKTPYFRHPARRYPKIS